MKRRYGVLTGVEQAPHLVGMNKQANHQRVVHDQPLTVRLTSRYLVNDPRVGVRLPVPLAAWCRPS